MPLLSISLPFLSHSLLSGFLLPPTPHHLAPVVKYSCRLMPLSSPETFRNALVFPAGVKTALIISLNIHVFDKTRSQWAEYWVCCLKTQPKNYEEFFHTNDQVLMHTGETNLLLLDHLRTLLLTHSTHMYFGGTVCLADARYWGYKKRWVLWEIIISFTFLLRKT